MMGICHICHKAICSPEEHSEAEQELYKPALDLYAEHERLENINYRKIANYEKKIEALKEEMRLAFHRAIHKRNQIAKRKPRNEH